MDDHRILVFRRYQQHLQGNVYRVTAGNGIQVQTRHSSTSRLIVLLTNGGTSFFRNVTEPLPGLTERTLWIGVCGIGPNPICSSRSGTLALAHAHLRFHPL